MSNIKNKKKYNYFYKITNTINGKYYYGIHSTDNLDDGYYGSGRLLKKAQSKYGIENFKKDILRFFDNRTDLANYEKEIVTEEMIRDSSCYNISCGGEFINTIGTILVKDKYGNVFRCFPDDPKYISGEYVSPSKGMVRTIDKNTGKFVQITKDEYYSNKEKYEMPEHKMLVKYKNDSSSNFFTVTLDEYNKNKDLYECKTSNKIPVKDKNNNHFYVDITDERYLSGELVPIFTGLKHSEETIQKIKEYKQKNIDRVSGENNPMFGKVWIQKNGESTRVNKNEIDTYLKDGWKIGRTIKDKSNFIGHPGCKWMHKGKKTLQVKSEDVQKYLLDGYKIGRKDKS